MRSLQKPSSFSSSFVVRSVGPRRRTALDANLNATSCQPALCGTTQTRVGSPRGDSHMLLCWIPIPCLMGGRKPRFVAERCQAGLQLGKLIGASFSSSHNGTKHSLLRCLVLVLERGTRSLVSVHLRNIQATLLMIGMRVAMSCATKENTSSPVTTELMEMIGKNEGVTPPYFSNSLLGFAPTALC